VGGGVRGRGKGTGYFICGGGEELFIRKVGLSCSVANAAYAGDDFF
jgi:hypothetical protein